MSIQFRRMLRAARLHDEAKRNGVVVIAWTDAKIETPKNRGDYLCWQPDINRDDELAIEARPVVLKWTGKSFMSSLVVSHWLGPIGAPSGETK